MVIMTDGHYTYHGAQSSAQNVWKGVTMLYTCNSYNIVCQLFSNKKKKTVCEWTVV